MSDKTVGRGVRLGLSEFQRMHLDSIYMAKQASYTSA